LIEKHRAAAPQRGKGARRRRFVEHVAAVAKRYDRGLYHCYDDTRIPQTSNQLEGKHGAGKKHERKVTGRASTSGGPMETAPEFHTVALDAIKRNAVKRSVLASVSDAEYSASRKALRVLMERSRRYRSIQRDPQKNLDRIVREFEAADA
jgi:hypothetical protein